jgi:hypothetical protein
MKEAAMWQVQASMALDLARERAAEAQAWRRAAALSKRRPSLLRRSTAAALRIVRDSAGAVAAFAAGLAERVEHPAV